MFKHGLVALILVVLSTAQLTGGSGAAAAGFGIGDTVEVFNTASSGLVVRGPSPCDLQTGGKFDGATGTVIDGPVFCSNFNRWRVQWSDGLVGWSAENWLRKTQTPPVARLTMTSGGQSAQENQILNLVVLSGGVVTVSFSAANSFDPDGAISAYSWKINGSQKSTSQTFNFPLVAGTHQIFLTVTDNQGLTGSVGASVVVATQAPPIAPTALSPGSASEPGPVITTLTPTLSWSAVSGADYYAVAISKHPYGSSNIIYNPQQVGGTSVQVSSGALAWGTKYRWNLQAHSSAGWSSVSNTLYFQAQGQTSPVARLTMTSGGQSAQENQILNLVVLSGGVVTVSFSAANSFDPDGAISAYSWKINGSQKSTSQTFNFPLVAGTHQIFLTVTDNQGLTGSVGASVVVATQAPPLLSAPTLSSPFSGQTGVSNTPLFAWTAVSGANKYWLTVATSAGTLPTDPNASSCPGCSVSANVSATSYTHSSALAHNTTYYWQVQSFNDSVSPIQQGQYSTQRSFNTGAPTLLSAPTLSSPFSGQTGVSNTPLFSWTAVSGANKYWLTVATSAGTLPTDPNASSCPGCSVSANVSATSYTHSSALAHNTTYYWQVQSFNDSVSPVQQGQYSAQRSFTTGAVALPNLVPFGLSAPSSAKPGETISLGWTVRNDGSSSAPSSSNTIRLVGQGVDLVLFSHSNSSLSTNGTTHQHNASGTLPADLSPGSYQIIVEVDSGDQVSESDETDNEVSSPLVVDSQIPVVDSLSVSSGSVSVGNSVTIFYSVSDTGGSGLKQVELWRAPDNGGSPGIWVKVDTKTASGSSSSGSFVDSLSSVGGYWYGIHAVNNAGNWAPQGTAVKVTAILDSVTLTLFVRDGSTTGPVIVGALVTGQDANGSSFNQPTNFSGYVTITGAPGTWSFTAAKSGYLIKTWSEGITSTGTNTAFLISLVVVPSAPLNLTATAGTASVFLSWNAPSSNGGATVTNYRIYRGTFSGGESLYTTISSSFTTFDNTANVSSGTTYYYKVAAVNSAGTGALSSGVNATPQVAVTVPSAPLNLTATAGTASVALSWSAPSSNGGATVTNYRIYRGTFSGGESLYTTISSAGTTFDNTANVSSGTTYYYKVAAVNSAGTGALSSGVNAKPQLAVTVPSAPQGLTATAGTTSVFLSWNAPSSNGGSAVTNYRIYRGTFSGGESFYTTISSSFTIFDNTANVSSGTTYYYKVAAVNSVGAGTLSSEASDTPLAAVTVPSAPLDLTATAGTASVFLTWNAPSSTGGAAVTNYRIYRGTFSGGESFYTTISSSFTIFDNTANVSSGTTYYYKVAAVNSVGEGPLSNEASGTPVAAVTVPSAPLNLTATAGTASVFLSWNAPSSTGGAAVTNYRIYRGTFSGGESFYTTISSSFTIFDNTANVGSGTTYYYKVAAVNSVGEGPLSNEASGTPVAAVTVPSAPLNPTASSANTLFEYYMACRGSSQPPLSARGGMYEAFGLGNATAYVGSSSQNTALLESLKKQGACPETAEGLSPIQTYTVMFVSQGKGEIVDPAGQLIAQNRYVGGSIVTLEANPEQGYVFSHWSGDLKGSKNPGIVTINSNLTGIAVFVPKSMDDVIQYANLADWELRELGRLVTLLSIGQRTREMSEEKLHLLDVAEALGARIENSDSWLNYNFVTGKTKRDYISDVASDMIIGATVHSLCLPLFALLGLPGALCEGVIFVVEAIPLVIPVVAEKMELGDLGTVRLHTPGESEITIDYSKGSGQVFIRVDVFDSSPGRIVAILPVVDVSRTLSGVQQLAPRWDAAKIVFPAVDVMTVQIQSPVELRVVDEGGLITGIVNGEIKRQILGSSYFDETVTIISNRQETGSAAYNITVVGETDGEYGIVIRRRSRLGAEILEMTNLDILAGTVHEYNLGAPASDSRHGQIILRIDHDGDGTFDEERVMSLNPIEPDGQPIWLWIVVAAFVSALASIVISVGLARRVRRDPLPDAVDETG